MNQRIIFPNDEGGVSIIIPADCGLTIEQIAAKDVPAGKPYKIVDVADIPADRTFRAAWEYQEWLRLTLTKPKQLPKTD